MDGRLDEPVWAEAPAITDFIQSNPAEGEPGTQPTEFRVAFDDNAIYIGAMLYDSFPISGRLARRDMGAGDFDYITINLDSYHDHETSYSFSVNPSRSRRDAVSSSGGGGGRGGGDTSWDPVWEVATQITEVGWSAEMRIPFSQLRFSPDEEQVWGIELTETSTVTRSGWPIPLHRPWSGEGHPGTRTSTGSRASDPVRGWSSYPTWRLVESIFSWGFPRASTSRTPIEADPITSVRPGWT